MNANERKYIWLLIGSIALTVVVFLYIRSSCLIPGADYGVDVYYHIKAGDLFPFFATTKQFPWTEMSIWKTNFYDKELGFHAIIYVLRHFGALIGISANAPFNFIDGVFVSAIVVLASLGSWLYSKSSSIIIPPLLVFISPFFFEKLAMIRPQLISIFLFIVVLFVLMLKSNIKVKCLLIFLLGWLYALCYSVPHIAFIPVFLYAIVSMIMNRKICSLFLVPSVIAGIAVGLTIHPQFPNTYHLWYIQGVEVVRKILGLNTSHVALGMGLAAPTAKSIYQNSLIYLLLVVNLILLVFSWLRQRRCRDTRHVSAPITFPEDKEDTRHVSLQVSSQEKDLVILEKNRERYARGLFLFAVQLVMLVGFLFSKRCIEYAVPAGVICFVYILDNYNIKSPHVRAFKFLSSLRIYIILGLFCILIMAPFNKTSLSKRFNAIKIAPCYKFANWASANLKAGTYIGLLNWADFPRLFYVSQQFKYSMALDPMFSYCAYPKRVEAIELFRRIKKPLSPKELSDSLGTDLVYCSKYDHIPVMYLIDHGGKVLYSDKQGFLLELVL